MDYGELMSNSQLVNIYLPTISTKPATNEFAGCVKNERAAEMARIFIESDWQQRVNPQCHPLLALAAQNKAEDMLKWRYFGHMSPIGIMPNQNVLRTGYPLPDWYDPHANNVESIGLNYRTPQDMFDAWRTGATHERHITGSHEFFRKQECFGCGYVRGEGDAGIYYVLVTAPCPEVN